MKIREKLSSLASALVLTVLVLTGVLQYVFQKRALRAQQLQHQADTIRQLVRVCEDALLEKPGQPLSSYATSMVPLDPVSYSPLLVNYTKTLLKFEPILYVAFLDLQGKPLFHSDLLKGDMGYMVINHKGEPTYLFAVSAKEILSRTSTYRGKPTREYAHPVSSHGKIAATVLVGYNIQASEDAMHKELKASIRRFLLVAFACLLIGVLGSAALAANFNRPLQRLVDGARKIGTGDLKHRIPVDRKDELGWLSEEFNTMGQKLAELDELKQSFLETITHDLRSPLVSIMGYIDIMLSGLSGELNDKQKSQLKIVQTSSSQLSQLVNNILDISKLEAGAMKIDLQPVQLNSLIGEIQAQMSVVADKYKVQLASDVPGDLPPVPLDLDLIRRVITNLVSNSLKFTPEGGKITVKVAREGNTHLRVSVTDTGCGIPKDKLKYMFTKFFQVEETKKQARKRGTGLGLTICKQVVEAHGGKIWVESEWQKGSSFIFTLLLEPSGQAPKPPAPAEATTGA